LVVRFWQQLVSLSRNARDLTEADLIHTVLMLIDIMLVTTLVTMTTMVEYDNFVSRVEDTNIGNTLS
jgi:uncharacterized protein (TIGR00645 family)